jgi:two-component system alkaline phosphatase synthesis response regulator PhoP
MSRVLIIEDDADIARALGGNLEAEGFQTRLAATGRAGIAAVETWRPHLVILDLRLPDMSGETVLAELRSAGDETPVLILSAKSDVMTKVRGFRAGADDYVTKPFALLELLARIERLARRQPAASAPAKLVRFGHVQVDPAARRITVRGEEVTVRPKEMDLLLALIGRPNQVVSRRALLDLVWDYSPNVESRTVDWHVAHLRQKIEPNPAKPVWLVTVRKAGYRFNLPADEREGLQ